MVETILRSITASIGKIGSENNQFRQVAAQQNTSISRFIKDISKMFSSQGKQQNEISGSLNDLQQVTAGTGQKVDQTNNLLQESISVQTQTLNEIKNLSSTILKLIQPLGGSEQDSSFGSTFMNMAGGAAIGAGIAGATGLMMGGLGNLNTQTLSGAGIAGAGSSEYANQAMEYFQSKGWTKEQAAGIVGNLQAESGKDLNPYLPGDGGKAFGVAQWHPDRQAKFQNVFGKPLSKASFQEQIEFVQWELENDEKEAANMLRQARTASEAAVIVDKHYERSSGLHTAKRIANAEALTGQERQQQTQTTPEGDGDFIKQSSPVNLQKYSLKDPSHVQGLDKSFQDSLGKFMNAAEESGHSIKLYSGYRSPERQKELFRNAVMKYGSPEAARKWVAPPGRSRHNQGIAADLKYLTPGAREWAHQNASKFGLNFRMAHEPWHIEPINAKATTLPSDNMQSGGSMSESSGGSSADIASMVSGTPLGPMSGIISGLSSAMDTMMGGLPNLMGLFGGSNEVTGQNISNIEFPEKETEFAQPTGETKIGAAISPVNQQIATPLEVPKNNTDYIQTAAMSNDLSLYNRQEYTAPTQTNPNESYQPNQDLQRGGMASTPSYSSTTPWYLQLAGRVSNDETMKFKGGVFA